MLKTLFVVSLLFLTSQSYAQWAPEDGRAVKYYGDQCALLLQTEGKQTKISIVWNTSELAQFNYSLYSFEKEAVDYALSLKENIQMVVEESRDEEGNLQTLMGFHKSVRIKQAIPRSTSERTLTLSKLGNRDVLVFQQRGPWLSLQTITNNSFGLCQFK